MSEAWHIEKGGERMVNTKACVIHAGNLGPVCFATKDAAALIVRAVNAHEALVAAATRALERIESDISTTCDEALALRAALAEATDANP